MTLPASYDTNQQDDRRHGGEKEDDADRITKIPNVGLADIGEEE